ncbi:hypothetical protein GF376_02770 [Candidatus Peregrinibacteria bacterium]|nr:hypothetical protein [Candidatus Peregrinibacteria bacterium]
MKQNQELNLDPAIKNQLLELQNKGVDINQIIKAGLQVREQKIEQAKAKETPAKSRYIPAKIKKIIKLEHGEKCSIPHCRKPAETVHHTRRWSMAKSHNPRYLAPLCKQHHQIAHAIDTQTFEKRNKT